MRGRSLQPPRARSSWRRGPLPATRAALAAIATGIVRNASSTRMLVRGSVSLPSRTPERQQRHERANPAAGLRDFELRGRELEDVPFANDGHACNREHRLAHPRREQLQGKRDLVEDDGGQRNHQEQQENRKGEQPQLFEPEQRPDRSGHHADERDSREEELCAEEPGEKNGEAARARGGTRLPPGLDWLSGQRLPLLPGKEQRKRKNDEAV